MYFKHLNSNINKDIKMIHGHEIYNISFLIGSYMYKYMYIFLLLLLRNKQYRT